LLAADVAHEVDRTLDQNPPEVRVLALPEQLAAGLNGDVGSVIGELLELVVAETVEELERPEVVGAHQIVAR
jgi:hypothetical protein